MAPSSQVPSLDIWRVRTLESYTYPWIAIAFVYLLCAEHIGICTKTQWKKTKQNQKKIIFHQLHGKWIIYVLFFFSVMYCCLCALKPWKGSHASPNFFMLCSSSAHAMSGHPEHSFHPSVACDPLWPLEITDWFLTHWNQRTKSCKIQWGQ